MRAILAHPHAVPRTARHCPPPGRMASWFRRKTPEAGATRRLSIEELASAFPESHQIVVPEAEATDEAPRPTITTPEPDHVADSATASFAAEVVAAVTITPETVITEPRLAPEDVPSPAAQQSATSQPAAAPGKPGWRQRITSILTRDITELFGRNPKLDEDLLDEIETALLTADVGVAASTHLVEAMRKRMKAREFADAQALLKALRGELVAMLAPVVKPLRVDIGKKPFVILTVGINGAGKTTTIGKLARRYKDEGLSLMLAAGDTFRAAAVAQLQAWGDRNGVAVIAQGQNADAASVAFDALQAAKSRGMDVLIADTAGRLHTQGGLMEELAKVRRVLAKLDPEAPHEVLMVIDGTTGQNAVNQVREFSKKVQVTGLVVTKLDGTAKGGVVFALAREFGIPIRYAGIGERPEDLRVFDAEAFVDALLPESLTG
jgi:fused signal recognition particle receptor